MTILKNWLSKGSSLSENWIKGRWKNTHPITALVIHIQESLGSIYIAILYFAPIRPCCSPLSHLYKYFFIWWSSFHHKVLYYQILMYYIFASKIKSNVDSDKIWEMIMATLLVPGSQSNGGDLNSRQKANPSLIKPTKPLPWRTFIYFRLLN